MADLEANFRSAVSEILTSATVAAFLAAVPVSLFTARRIVNPICAMTQASQRIAAGDYHQRVKALSQDELGSMAQAFNQMADTLEQTEQRRLALIGNVAHELRTPLVENIIEHRTIFASSWESRNSTDSIWFLYKQRQGGAGRVGGWGAPG